ncbi:nuclear RNA export factor 1-like [Microplitis demolitor]|uniref:nuclear RNA export factor 1-like n=1 Tax=Microplitis demolitor TaxID=69319 RepID=UPI0004CD8C81|nr:nuclear RNA export factor 1-like [Microplitis demolitor]XP_014299245.1 nuclear RNA export factor 1-like [Microplitis demolitor]
MSKFTGKSIKSRLGFFLRNGDDNDDDDDDATSNMDWSSSRQKISFKIRNKSQPKSIGFINGNNGHDDDDDDDKKGKNKSLVLFTRKNRLSGTEPYNVSRRPKTVWNKLDNLSEANWYQIVMPHVHMYDKKILIDALLNYMKPQTFVPIMYKIINRKVIFYVDNQEAAESLVNCHEKICIERDFKIHIYSHSSGFPKFEFDEVFKMRIRLAMASRYVEETKSLDLSCFHLDVHLIDDYFCALFRPEILIYVLEIAAEAVPHLEALNLENNKLSKIEKLTVLSTHFKNLKILYLGNNKIRYESTLKVLKNLKLEELRLEGNDFISKLQKMDLNYSTVIREKFPNLVRLDGKPLPKIIKFDIEETKSLPEFIKFFATNSHVLTITQQFIKLYFDIYDSDSRQPLLDAYLDNAVFTMTIDPKSTIDVNSVYASGDRNLIHTKNFRRIKLFNTGRLHIVTCLSGFPKTQHLAETFTIDIKALTESMMIITITGLFKELGVKTNTVRFFSRTFIIEQFGTGYCISNEQLHLTDATKNQQQFIDQQQLVYQQQLSHQQQQQNIVQTTQSLEGIPSTPAPVSSPMIPNRNTQLPDAIKEQMTRALSVTTKMNYEWSYKCLTEVNWIYDVGIKAFEEHHKRGAIPPEAFR